MTATGSEGLLATPCHRCGRPVAPGPHACDPPEVQLFFDKRGAARALFEHLWETVRGLGRVQVASTKSRVAFVVRRRFIWVHEAGLDAIWIGFVLDHDVESERLRSAKRGSVWAHHLKIDSPEAIDEEVRGWLGEAYLFETSR